MNTQQTRELGFFKNAIAIIFGVSAMVLGSKLISFVLASALGYVGNLIAFVVIIAATIYLAHDRLINDGKNTYQHKENPFERRVVKAMTGNAVCGVVFWVGFIVWMVLDK